MTFSSGFLDRSANDIQQILKDANASQGSVHVEQTGTKTAKQYRTFYNNRERQHSEDSEDGDLTIYAIASLTKFLVSLTLTVIFDTLAFSDKPKHERYRMLQRFKTPWDVKFTELFNTFSGPQIEDLPGNPTLFHLLVHFNGLPPMTHVLLGPEGTSLMSKESFLEVAPRLANLLYGNTQGGRSLYSNGNYVLVGLLIEAIAKEPLESVMQEHLFAPLGMTRTFLGAPNSSVTGIAPPYTLSVDDGHRQPTEIQPYPAGDILNAALGAYSCVRDLAIMFRTLLAAIDGRSALLKQVTIRNCLRWQMSWNNSEAGVTMFGFRTELNSSTVGSRSLNRLITPDDICSTYRLGRRQDGKEVPAYYLAGHIEGYSSCFYFMPQWSTFVITLTNTTGNHDASDHISRLLLQGIFDLEHPRRSVTGLRTAGPSQKVDILAMSSQAAVEGKKLLKKFAAEYAEQDKAGVDLIQLDGAYINGDTGLSIIIRSNSSLVNIVGTARTTSMEPVRTKDMGIIRTGNDTIRLRPLSKVGFTLDRYDDYNWKNLTFHLLIDNTNKKVMHLERQVGGLVDRFTRREI